jgi:hypothetical protein
MLKFANLHNFLKQVPAESLDYSTARELMNKIASLGDPGVNAVTQGNGQPSSASLPDGTPSTSTNSNPNHFGDNEMITNVSGNSFAESKPTTKIEDLMLTSAFPELQEEKEKQDLQKLSSWDRLRSKYGHRNDR